MTIPSAIYIPARRKHTEAERAALKEAASRLQEALAAEGISEQEVIQDFRRWRHSREAHWTVR
jgi:hypothetical protein